MPSQNHKKPQVGRNHSRQSSVTLITSNALSVAASSVTSSTASPSTSKSKGTRKALDYFGFESSVCSVGNNDSVPVPKRHNSTNPVIDTVIQEEALQPPVIDTSFELPIVSPPAPPTIGIWFPEENDYNYYARQISMSVFDAKNQI